MKKAKKVSKKKRTGSRAAVKNAAPLTFEERQRSILAALAPVAIARAAADDHLRLREDNQPMSGDVTWWVHGSK